MSPVITVTEAEELVLASTPVLPTRRVRFSEAVGCILREPILAERAGPPFDRVMVDGIAINTLHLAGNDPRHFHLQAFAPAGAPAIKLEVPGNAIEVATGAVLPLGCDAVIPYEQLDIVASEVRIKDGFYVKPGQYIHARGVDYPAEALLLDIGIKITAREMAVLASCGCAKVCVSAIPRIHIIVLGEKLRGISESVEPYELRCSNVYAVQSALALCCHREVSLHHLADDSSIVAEALPPILEAADIVLFSNANLLSKHRDIWQTLTGLGLEVHFCGVEQRPGKSLVFGTMPGGKLFFALPRDPVASLICTIRYVLPAMRKLSGRRPYEAIWAALCDAWHFAPTMTCFLPVQLSSRRDATMTVQPLQTGFSEDFATLVQSDGFVELPADLQDFPPGYSARFFPWGPGIYC